MSNFMRIRQVGRTLFHADSGMRDGNTVRLI